LKGRLLGNAAALAALLVFGFKPALGQVQPAVQKRVSFGVE